MAYDCSSTMFRKMPEELRGEDGLFRRGVRILSANRERLGELEEELYELVRDPASVADKDWKHLAEALGPSWDPAEIEILVRAAVTWDLAIHEFTGDHPDDWIADLVELGFLDRPAAEALVDELMTMHERHHVRERTDNGVLPAFEALGYTTEIRGGMHDGRPLRVTGICSVALHLDTDDPATYFQLNRAQLQKLIATLQKAEKELGVLERSLVGIS